MALNELTGSLVPDLLNGATLAGSLDYPVFASAGSLYTMTLAVTPNARQRTLIAVNTMNVVLSALNVFLASSSAYPFTNIGQTQALTAPTKAGSGAAYTDRDASLIGANVLVLGISASVGTLPTSGALKLYLVEVGVS